MKHSVFILSVWLIISAPMAAPDSPTAAVPPISGIKFQALRCKTGCQGGKFHFDMILFNHSDQKIRVDKNELKYKLRVSYKPGAPKGKKKPVSQPFKTIAFMQGSGSTEEWIELEPNDFIGVRKEVELGEFDKGLCGSPAITLYGTLKIIGQNSNPEFEINEKIGGNCSF